MPGEASADTPVERFEALAYDVIATHGGRVIKMIGHEVMFAIADPSAAGHAALDIVEACEADALIPSVRVGVARGSVLRHEADLFGPTVNLASRLVNITKLGSVLVSEDFASSIDDKPEFVLRRLRPRRLGDTRILVLRRDSAREGRHPAGATTRLTPVRPRSVAINVADSEELRRP